MKGIIIAGGSGFIGRQLANHFKGLGYRIFILSRKPENNNTDYQYYKWDISQKVFPVELFEEAGTIINLTGTNVGEKRWDRKFKNEILKSRTESTRLIVEKMNTFSGHSLTLINASAVGYYGFNYNNPVDENGFPGNDFMAEVCIAWEKEAYKLNTTMHRLVIARIGVVFSTMGGALQRMISPFKYLAGAPLASGNQYVSWIHIEDLCRAFSFLEDHNNILGAVNISAPYPAKNKDITGLISKLLRIPVILPNIPSFTLRLVLGEFAESVTGSQQVIPGILSANGFTFDYPSISEALKDLITHKK